MPTRRVALVLIVPLVLGALALPTFAKKETGGLEGTVVDQDGTPLKGAAIDVNRIGYELGPLGSAYRFLLRTDKRGHFLYLHFPAGAYSLKIVGQDGRILKEIPEVRVEVGKVQNLDSELHVVM
jgi:hypothetical protein